MTMLISAHKPDPAGPAGRSCRARRKIKRGICRKAWQSPPRALLTHNRKCQSCYAAERIAWSMAAVLCADAPPREVLLSEPKGERRVESSNRDSPKRDPTA